MASFFLRDFSQEIHQKAALKNAYVLLSRHEYIKAAGFLLLANKQQEALQVLIKNSHDPQLALFLSIILEGDQSFSYQSIMNSHMNQVSQYTHDVYLQAVIAWYNQDYSLALHSLLSSFDPNHYCQEEQCVDRYFLDNHADCSCLHYPMSHIAHHTSSPSSPRSALTPTDQNHSVQLPVLFSIHFSNMVTLMFSYLFSQINSNSH